MFNVAVLKMKDVLKYLVGFTVTIFAVVIATRYFSSKKIDISSMQYVKEESAVSFVSCMEQTIPGMEQVNEEYKKVADEGEDMGVGAGYSYLEGFLQTEIASMKGIDRIEKQKLIKQLKEANAQKVTEQEENISNNTNQTDNLSEGTETVEMANTNQTTQVVTNNPIAENFNFQYGAVKIKNQTSYTLTEEMMKPDVEVTNKNILLFHTHSCESYTSSEKYPYTPTGNFRTTDLNFTVTRVGTELENQLKQYGYSVTHDKSYHDYPAYNGSYTRSLATVENILKTIPSDIIIDVHRDAVGSRSDYAPTVKIGDDYAAQIMYVIGTNGGGLYHPNWNQNLKFAIKVQQKAEEMYPGLFKPIMLTNSRYNQHTGKFASIIEVGATGNTLEQCLCSMKYLAKVLDEVLK